ncbi:hypothetical protein ASG37_16915 [Sphingomonas sp. Leaf407]|nr:hypothetical protein ASE97_16905 [Sphingomonas sp. Leaf42]KQT23658.1 hypothetical protein ASG37_16915 [Sphingomonas sp. Leaf407]
MKPLHQEQAMTDTTRSDHDIASPADLPIQPTGSGVADLEIAKLQAALEEGAEDESIAMPIPDDDPTPTRA